MFIVAASIAEVEKGAVAMEADAMEAPNDDEHGTDDESGVDGDEGTSSNEEVDGADDVNAYEAKRGM